MTTQEWRDHILDMPYVYSYEQAAETGFKLLEDKDKRIAELEQALEDKQVLLDLAHDNFSEFLANSN
jgi:hypothetical protein